MGFFLQGDSFITKCTRLLALIKETAKFLATKMWVSNCWIPQYEHPSHLYLIFSGKMLERQNCS